jgi:GNT-I family
VYYRIANHYKFIMQQMFDCREYGRLILVEDDMLFAPDFFSYFAATSKILDQAPPCLKFALLSAICALQPLLCYAASGACAIWGLSAQLGVMLINATLFRK